MSNEQEDYAVNAMAAQVVYGDDDLKRDMEDFVINTIIKVLQNMERPDLTATLVLALQERMGRQIIVNHAREIERIVARYLTNKMSGDQY